MLNGGRTKKMLMYILYFALLGGASALAIILLCLAIEGGGKK